MLMLRILYIGQVCSLTTINVTSKLSSLQSGWTALMTACRKGDFETLKKLLNAGANPNLKSKVCCAGSSNLVACMHNMHDVTAEE